MYRIIKYKTISGGGIAFVDYSVPESKALVSVLRAVKHNHSSVKVEIIGFCKTLDTSKLKCVTEYETYDDDEEMFYKVHALDHPVYYQGGDCC